MQVELLVVTDTGTSTVRVDLDLSSMRASETDFLESPTIIKLEVDRSAVEDGTASMSAAFDLRAHGIFIEPPRLLSNLSAMHRPLIPSFASITFMAALRLSNRI